jgi:hypothetical protein
MKPRLPSPLRLAIFLVTYLTCPTVWRATAGDPTDPERIEAVLTGREHHYASARNGLYRASVSADAWEPVQIPESMPSGGSMTGSTDSEGDLYYYAVRGYKPPRVQGDRPIPLPVPQQWVYGLYRKPAGNDAWELTSRDEGFQHVLAFGGRVFAIAAKPADPGTPQRILESTDRGSTWRALPATPAAAGYLTGLFPDPAHPDQVCVYADGLRRLILRAPDPSYQWEVEKPSAWARRQTSGESIFLRPEEHSIGVPVTPATLGNFLRIPREFRPALNPTLVPCLWIEPGQERTFRADADVVLTVQMQTGPGFPPTPAKGFVDVAGATDLWSLYRITPSGLVEVFRPTAPTDRTRQSASWISEPLRPEGPRRRTLNLSGLAPFREPGRYRVQVVYDSTGVSRKRPREWALQLVSPVIEIEVK